MRPIGLIVLQKTAVQTTSCLAKISKFVDFLGQAMSQRTFRSKLFEQNLGFVQSVRIQLAGFDEFPKTTFHFRFGEQGATSSFESSAVSYVFDSRSRLVIRNPA